MEEKYYYFDRNSYCVKEKNNKYLLYDNRRGKLLWVNRTGYFILDKLDGRHSVEQIIQDMAAAYELNTDIVAEYVNKQIGELLVDNLIFIDDKRDENIDCTGISRLYIEVSQEIDEKVYLKNTNRIAEILDLVLSNTDEERMLLFVDCSHILDIKFLSDLFEIIRSRKRIESYIRMDYRTISKELMEKLNKQKMRIVLPYDFQQVDENSTIMENFKEKVNNLIKQNIMCYLGIAVGGMKSEELCEIQQYGFDIGMTGIFLDDVDPKEADIVENLYKNNMFLNSWKNNRIKRRDNYFVILMYKNFCQNMIQHIRNKIHCGIGIEELYVDFADNVYPCHRLKTDRFKYNDIEEFLKIRRQEFGENIIANNCKDCFAWTLCNGGCKAQNIIDGISLDAPVSSCKEKRKGVDKLFT